MKNQNLQRVPRRFARRSRGEPDGFALTEAAARVEVQQQHQALREMMDRCEELADAIDAGQVRELTPLHRAVAQVRVAFAVHRVFEAQVLTPVLLAVDASGALPIDRVLEPDPTPRLSTPPRLSPNRTGDVRDVIATLRAHIDAEERFLLRR